jgi:hypothetical protein
VEVRQLGLLSGFDLPLGEIRVAAGTLALLVLQEALLPLIVDGGGTVDDCGGECVVGGTLEVVGVAALVGLHGVGVVVVFFALLTVEARREALNALLVDGFEGGDLVVEDHVVGDVVDASVVGVGEEGGAEGLEHEHAAEDAGVLPDEGGDGLDGEPAADVDEALLDDVPQLLDEDVFIRLLQVGLLDVVAHQEVPLVAVVVFNALLLQRRDDTPQNVHPLLVFAHD